jgi:hypothetical protein
MTSDQFIYRLSAVVVAALVAAFLLHSALGPSWIRFYGWPVVAVATLPFVTWLLWKRLPPAGWNRWWSLLFALPLGLVAVTHTAFWMLFFAQGATNPIFGVMREMVRPAIATVEPYAVLGFIAVCAALLNICARGNSSAA